MWARVKSEKVECFVCTIHPKVIVVWHLTPLRSLQQQIQVFMLSLQHCFHPSFQIICGSPRRENFLAVLGLWSQPVRSCIVQAAAWVGQEAKSQPGDTPRPWEKWTDPDLGCRDQQNPLVGVVFVINDTPPKPGGIVLLHQHLVGGHLLWHDLSSPGHWQPTQLPQHHSL